ncbi:hypothetical protein ABQD56_02565 [Vagococcus fluvialis]|uniref:hypothetical protein n=1 Tax=Vagococcus fluvialis TaxID=2738 RepID=UPI00288F0951|nr:hypothetical protein [Vagococcus fluvialis]MDT2780555.1 hypothetical protein [Vagococcus fluvialis]
MGKQIVEYLYYAKKGTVENIEEIFRGIMSNFSSDSQFQYDFEWESLMFQCEIEPYGDSLNVVFTYNKSGQIGIKEVRVFQNFLEKINIEVSKSRINHTTLLDTNSLFFSKKLLPYLHNYEWSMRKLIYLVAPTYFSDNWVEKSVPKKIINNIKQKQKGEYDAKNLLQSLDLFDIEEYLFGENYVKISSDEEINVFRFKEYDSNELIDFFSEGTYTMSKPHSLWEDIFSQYVDIELEEIQLDMKLIREGRNSVSHNKEITEQLYQELRKKLKLYIKLLESAFTKMLSGSINTEELNDMEDDFEGYVDNRLNRSDITGINKFTENFAKQISAREALKKQMDATGINKFTENFAKQVSAREALKKQMDATGINKFTENLAKQVSAHEALMRRIDATTGINKFTENFAKQVSAREALKKQMDATGINTFTENFAKQVSAHEALMRRIDTTTGMNKFTENFAKQVSAHEALMRRIDTTTGMNKFTENFAKQVSAHEALMRRIDTTGMNKFTERLSKQIPAQKNSIERQDMTEKSRDRKDLDKQRLFQEKNTDDEDTKN